MSDATLVVYNSEKLIKSCLRVNWRCLVLHGKTACYYAERADYLIQSRTFAVESTHIFVGCWLLRMQGSLHANDSRKDFKISSAYLGLYSYIKLCSYSYVLTLADLVGHHWQSTKILSLAIMYFLQFDSLKKQFAN